MNISRLNLVNYKHLILTFFLTGFFIKNHYIFDLGNLQDNLRFFFLFCTILLVLFFFKINSDALKQIFLFITLYSYLLVISYINFEFSFFSFIKDNIDFLAFSILTFLIFSNIYRSVTSSGLNIVCANTMIFLGYFFIILSIYFNQLNFEDNRLYLIFRDETSIFNYSQTSSEFFGLTALLSLLIYFNYRRNIFYLINFLINFFYLFITGGKGGIITTLFLIFLLISSLKLNSKKNLLLIFVSFSLILILIFNENYDLRGIERIGSFFNYGLDYSRFSLYSNIFNANFENCLIFGCGINPIENSSIFEEVRYTFSDDGGINRTHNLILELILSFGAIIFLLATFFFIKGMYKIFKYYGWNNFFIIMFLFYFIDSLKGFNITESYMMISFIIFFISIGTKKTI